MNQAKMSVAMVAALLGTLGLGVLGAGCSVGSSDDAASDVPNAEPEGVETAQLITSVNADGTWTADALLPEDSAPPSLSVRAIATFTGPTGKTRKLGVCSLKEHRSSGIPVACTTVADCANAPTTLPTGGYRYCTAPGGTGTAYCFYRPGPSTSYCAGSPALAGALVAPGTYRTPFQAASNGTVWISYGCFEGCTATDPSSASTFVFHYDAQWCSAHPGGC